MNTHGNDRNASLWPALALVMAAVSAPARTPSDTPVPDTPPASPCTTETGPARDFDFWIGEWAVFRPGTDERAGTNRIRSREQGCLLVEDWSGASGGTGMSLNFYDPHREAWRQVWQSAQVLIELEGGLDEQGRMAMDGTVFYHARGERFPFRGRWTPRDDGTVLQEFWQQAADGEWRPWFAGEYRPADRADRVVEDRPKDDALTLP